MTLCVFMPLCKYIIIMLLSFIVNMTDIRDLLISSDSGR